MITLEKLFKFNKLGLNLSDLLVYMVIRSLKGPSTVSGLLACQNLNLKERQLRNILTRLEENNLLVKFRNQYNQLFALPFVFLKKIKKPYKPKNGIKLQVKTGKNLVTIVSENLRVAKLYHNSYIYNNYIKLRKDITQLNIITKHNVKEEETTFKYNNNKRNIVVNKNNYNKIKVIKEKFPDKNAFIALELPKDFNYALLKEKINNSTFLKDKRNLGLNWFIKNYEAVINNFYATIENKTFSYVSEPNFSQRTYSSEDLQNIYSEL